jgi:hypothetical protein
MCKISFMAHLIMEEQVQNPQGRWLTGDPGEEAVGVQRSLLVEFLPMWVVALCSLKAFD